MTGVLVDDGVRSPAVTSVRERLGARHHEVLAALLAGEVPEGFDPRTTQVTGLVLRRKRWRAALAAFPLLGRAPGAADSFDRYARGHRHSGCAHDDVTSYLDWARREAWPPAAGLGRCWRVERGERRTAWARLGGRRVLLVGLGSSVHEFPLGGGWSA